MAPASAAIQLAVAVTAALLVAVLAPAAPAGAASVVLDGVTVRLATGTTQVVTVNHTASWHARVTLWERAAGGWRPVARARDGRTGYGGLVAGTERRQGTGTTPLGSYRLLGSFGTHDRSTGWDLGYRRIRSGDYWVADNRSDHYNRYRNKAQGGFRWWLTTGIDESERLTDFPRQYEYVVNTSFNRRQVRYRGAGIFLHVNGDGATAGCISAPRWFLQTALDRLDPRRVPVIAIGR